LPTQNTTSQPIDPLSDAPPGTLLKGYAAVLPDATDPLPFQMIATDYAKMSHLQQQLYQWHICHGYMNFATFQSMACK